MYSTSGSCCRVTAQVDALFQVVHGKQVIFPLRVDHAQHDHALVIAHGVGADQLFLGVVAVFEFFENRVAQFLAVHLLGLQAFGVDVDAEARKDRVFQSLKVPVVDVRPSADSAAPACRRVFRRRSLR